MPPSQSYIKTVGAVGAVANWMIPLAAIASAVNDEPARVNPGMTGALALYSVFFLRWSIAISPPNPALFACHAANEAAQLTQLFRWGKWRFSDSGASAASPAAAVPTPSASTASVSSK